MKDSVGNDLPSYVFLHPNAPILHISKALSINVLICACKIHLDMGDFVVYNNVEKLAIIKRKDGTEITLSHA